MGALLLLVLWRSDTFLVAGLLSPARLGVYAVGVAVAEVPQAVSAGLRPRSSPACGSWTTLASRCSCSPG